MTSSPTQLSQQAYRNISVLLSLLFLALVPAARSLQSYFNDQLDTLSQFIFFKPLLVAVLASILMLVCVKAIRNFMKLPAWISLIQALMLLLAFSIAYLADALPVEITHLFQYAALSFSAVLGFGNENKSMPFQLSLGLMISQIISLLDEGLQGLHPERFFDVRDLFFNLVGGMVGASLALSRLHKNLKKKLSTATKS